LTWEGGPRAGNLVFTSAGDHNKLLENWVGPGMNYDVFIAYYGDSSKKYLEYVEKCRWVVWHKGSKIGNFWEMLYINHRPLLDKSEYIFMLDDDIWFHKNVSDINKMFEMSRAHNLTISMPSFAPETSRVSWPITRHDPRPNLLFTFTSNVEFNAPLLTRAAAIKTMQIYDPSIIGWGSCHLAVCANGDDHRTFAVVHSVVSTNPPLRHDTGERELHRLQYWEKRKDVWEAYADSIGCRRYYEQINYESVFTSPPGTAGATDGGLVHVLHPTKAPTLFPPKPKPKETRRWKRWTGGTKVGCEHPADFC